MWIDRWTQKAKKYVVCYFSNCLTHDCEKGFRAGLVALLQCHFRTLYLCSNAQKRNLIKIGCVECRLWYVEAGKGKSFRAQWNFQSLHVWNMQNTKLKKAISNLIFDTKFSGQFISIFFNNPAKTNFYDILNHMNLIVFKLTLNLIEINHILGASRLTRKVW